VSLMKQKPKHRRRTNHRTIGWLATGASAVAMTAAVALPTVPANAAPAAPAAPSRPDTSQLAAKPTVAGYVAPKETLQYGDSGPDVLALQHRLHNLHYWLKITGVFDFDTQEAVYAFQAVNGLTMDGIVGPLTKHALVDPHTYKAQDPSVPTRIEVNISPKVEILAYYKNNQLQLISHVSSAGGYHFCDSNGCQVATTPTGWYRANWFDPGWVKVPLGEMYNPVFFIGGEYAIHGDTAVPNYPASHGCIRIPDDLASVFHTYISVSYTHGTRIHVYSRASV
jgi:peptidoglycan hydrolase-like protein with peptidoglycan-binding domain